MSFPSPARSIAAAREALARAPATTQPAAEQMLSALAETATGLPGVTAGRNPLAFLDGLIHQLDRQVSDQLNVVMHAEPFQRLEGSYRGLKRLVDDTDTNRTLWVEVLDAAKHDLAADFAGAADAAHTALWRQVYDDRYDTSGGKPLGAIVTGHAFAHGADDVALLRGLATVAAAAQAPLIANADPALLMLRSFADLKRLDRPDTGTPDHAEWNALRRNPDSRFVALAAPRVLARAPYSTKAHPADGIAFDEAPTDERTGRPMAIEPGHLCWSPAAYALGGVLSRAFRQTNWCSAIAGDARGRLTGGSVRGLPLYRYHTASGNAAVAPPTESALSGQWELALSEQGLLPLSHELGTDKAVFVGGRTVYAPTPGADDQAAALLANVLPAGRIAHHLKVIGRRLHGRFATADQLADFVHDWLANFKSDPSASDEAKAARPVKAFAVTAASGHGPGVFDVRLRVAFWSPVVQVNADVEIVAEVDTAA
jgi:type VI secretion system protein ImpC